MLSRQQCRDADATAIHQFGIPGVVLMENAGRGCVELLLNHAPQDDRTDQSVLLLCGPGNNGGDGFVMARHLYNVGVSVKVVLFAPWEAYSGDALINLRALSRLKLPVVELDHRWHEKKLKSVFGNIKRTSTRWIVDAMLGTGAQGNPRPPFRIAIEIANQMDAKRFAVDIPTGLDCDTGEPTEPTFQADLTGTFIDHKLGFQNPAASVFLGDVSVVDIGAPPEILP